VVSQPEIPEVVRVRCLAFTLGCRFFAPNGFQRSAPGVLTPEMDLMALSTILLWSFSRMENKRSNQRYVRN
jgi:hypothetical protein